MSKGPSYREPCTIDFDKNQTEIIEQVKLMLDLWCSKEKIPLICLDGWFNEFCKILSEETVKLKVRYSKDIRHKSVFKNQESKKELEYLHKYFVLCPIDKATKNVAIICKQFYLNNILEECETNNGITVVTDKSVELINNCIHSFIKDIGIKTDSTNESLPTIFSSPKFHKPVLKFRYVISYSKCSIRPLAIKVSLGLKAVYSEICRYTKMLNIVTGVSRNWIILNNKPIIDAIESINENGIARNIQTFDFSTLYTNLEHKDIKEALIFIIKLAFRNRKSKSESKYISVYDKSSNWVSSHRDSTFAFDESKLIKCIEFLLDNCYFEVGNSIYKQIIGVPIGINPGPYMANLTLWYFENRFINSTYKSKYHIVKKLSRTFRLIDDITTLNSDGCLAEYYRLIYPSSLTLNKENAIDTCANVLDLEISIKNGKFISKVYDKRDNFNFNIVQYQPINSNQSSDILYGTFYSQIIRYSRICNDLTNFSERVIRITNDLINLGFDTARLRKMFVSIVDRHRLVSKFSRECRGILVP